ncbi:MAG: nucleotidyltransferase, partial [Hadesarchaea archaeon]|nr:nucleotidyltransferase [Hadesarchaea archaeon]
EEYLMTDYLEKGHMELTGEVLRGDASTCTSSEIDVLTDLGAPRIPEVLSEYGINPDETARLLLGEHEKSYLGQIIHSDIDIDQMDYLLRDAHFTGVALGRVDTDRLMRTLTVSEDNLVIERKGIEAAEGLLTARALMFSSVYFHHTTRIAELMLANAVDYALSEDTVITKQNFCRMSDEELSEKLYSVNGYPREMITRIRYRQLFKTAYREERRELGPKEKETIIENYGEWHSIREKQEEIAEKAGVPKGMVILDVPIVDLLISEPRIEKVGIPVKTEDGLSSLSDMSTLAPALRERQTPRYLVRVTSPPKYLSEVKKATSEVLEQSFAP